MSCMYVLTSRNLKNPLATLHLTIFKSQPPRLDIPPQK